MDRRTALRRGLSVAATMAVGGCGARSTAGPDPAVLEHFHGEPVVVDTSERMRLGQYNRFRATVQQRGHAGEVAVIFFWVPDVEARPKGRSEQALLEAGYEKEAERRFALAAGERRRVSVEARVPSGVAGYFFRAQNLTYGARVRNRGGSGEVTATLVDTTDMSNQVVLARKSFEMAADETRPVTFTTDRWFETFRIDVAAG